MKILACQCRLGLVSFDPGEAAINRLNSYSGLKTAAMAPYAVERSAVRFAILLAVVAAITLGLSGCTKADSYRYRLTVEVDTPQGLRTGSSVIEVGFLKIPDWLPNGGGVSIKYRGEAVAVDLPDGQIVFAPFRSGWR